MSRRKTIIKDAGIYALGSYGARLFDIVNGIAIRHFLGPVAMGIWAFFQVILNYAKHSGLGVTTATARDVPYYRAKGDEAKADAIKDLVFSFTVTTAFIASVGIATYSLLNRSHYSDPLFYGFFAVAVIFMLQRIYDLFVVLLRAHKEFVFAGILNLVSSVSNVILTVALTWKFKLYGLFVALIANYVFLIGFIYWRKPYRFKFRFSLDGMRPLLSLGSAVLITDVFRTTMLNIDRIMISAFLGFQALGIYSIALMASNYLRSLPNMLNVVFFPHFQEAFAERDNYRDLEKYLREPALCVAFLFPFVSGLAWVISSWIVPWILPAYSGGVPALKFICLACFFTAVTHPFSTFILTVKKQWLLVPLQATSAVLGFGITWFMIKKGWGIEGVAIASLIIAAINFSIFSMMALKFVYSSWQKMAIFYLKIVTTFGYSAFLLLTLDRVFNSADPSLLKCVLQYGAYFVCMSPLLYWVEREIGLISTIGSMIRDRIHRKAQDKIETEPNDAVPEMAALKEEMQ